ncbi:hypothetical protein [Micromonospora sp. CA-111912]|uniref:hypothetical protein n=1 Tax=Micromonospora sp. CA-111912 TaxID=3239955 RepID=UPI003D8A4C0E
MPENLSDIPRAEAFKRLGRRLHTFPSAALACAVARGEVPAASLASQVSARFAEGNVIGAVSLLGAAPGMLLRQVDRAAVRLDPAAVRQGRACGHAELRPRPALASRAPGAPNRRARSVRETDLLRARWTRLDDAGHAPAAALIGIGRRLPETAHLVVDPEVHPRRAPARQQADRGRVAGVAVWLARPSSSSNPGSIPPLPMSAPAPPRRSDRHARLSRVK